MTAAVTAPPQSPLAEGQWQIEDLVFGKDTRFPIATFPDIAFGEITNQDAAIPREGGLMMGRDTDGANLITFDMAVWSPNLDRDLGWLANWWRNHPVKNQPGQAIPLRYCFEGRQRQVFGRPRNFAASMGTTRREWVPVLADFQCVDDQFYSAERFSHRVGLYPSSPGGFTAPFVAPFRSSNVRGASPVTDFTVGGVSQAWAELTVYGPIMTPRVDLYGQWTQVMPRVSLNYDQTLTARSEPWARGIVDERGRGVAGVFDANSRKLSALTIPPGDHELVLSGLDVTGTAAVELSWLETYPAP